MEIWQIALKSLFMQLKLRMNLKKYKKKFRAELEISFQHQNQDTMLYSHWMYPMRNQIYKTKVFMIIISSNLLLGHLKKISLLQKDKTLLIN
jgi:hypothetical protein